MAVLAGSVDGNGSRLDRCGFDPTTFGGKFRCTTTETIHKLFIKLFLNRCNS